MGDRDSPIIPLLLYHPAKMPLFSRECLKEHVRTHRPKEKDLANLFPTQDRGGSGGFPSRALTGLPYPFLYVSRSQPRNAGEGH